MEIRLVMKTARSVSLELDDGGIYKTKEVYRILVNLSLIHILFLRQQLHF